MANTALWKRFLSDLPLVAVLRGIAPSDVVGIAEVLEGAGFLCLEVPLNSPDPLSSVKHLREHFDGRLLVGAGTVLSPADVRAAQAAGAELIVSPNTNPETIRATKSSGLLSMPGFLTPSEAFAAHDAGADILKLFPASAASPPVLRAYGAVLPKNVPVFPMGGITPGSMKDYVNAGAAGFGIGGELYKPGYTIDAVRERANAFVKSWNDLRN